MHDLITSPKFQPSHQTNLSSQQTYPSYHQFSKLTHPTPGLSSTADISLNLMGENLYIKHYGDLTYLLLLPEKIGIIKCSVTNSDTVPELFFTKVQCLNPQLLWTIEKCDTFVECSRMLRSCTKLTLCTGWSSALLCPTQLTIRAKED